MERGRWTEGEKTAVDMQFRVSVGISGTPLIQTPMGQKKVSILVRCPGLQKHFSEGKKRCPFYRLERSLQTTHMVN